MAFCTKCGNDMQEERYCTHCNNSIEKFGGSKQEVCPFCRTVVHEGAVVCHNCQARKGYMGYNIFSFERDLLLKQIRHPSVIFISRLLIGLGIIFFLVNFINYSIVPGLIFGAPFLIMGVLIEIWVNNITGKVSKTPAWYK